MHEKDLRCPICESEPILAKYGIDEDGLLFVHIKVYKAKQIKSEAFIRGGEVTLRCYRCGRYQVVRIRQDTAVLNRTRRPELISDDDEPLTVDPPSFDT